jgi:uncharacterized protein YbjT (DUF2867 family)
MPVLITGSHRLLARRLLTRLAEEGGEVRAYGHGDGGALRAAGVFVAYGDADDEGRLDAAMTEAHTVVHIGPGLLTPDASRVAAEARVVARAAASAGVRRVIALSLPGAASDAPDAFRRAKAAEEEAIAAIPVPTIVIRASLVDTVAVRDALLTGGADAVTSAVELAPVRVDDLVEVVVAFDRARSRLDDGHLLVAADGPSRLTVGQYLERVGARVGGRTSLLGRRVLAADHLARLRETLTGGPWWSEPEAALDGWRFARYEPRTPGP